MVLVPFERIISSPVHVKIIHYTGRNVNSALVRIFVKKGVCAQLLQTVFLCGIMYVQIIWALSIMIWKNERGILWEEVMDFWIFFLKV